MLPPKFRPHLSHFCLAVAFALYPTIAVSQAKKTAPSASPGKPLPVATPKPFVFPEEDEEEDKEKLQGLTVRSEEQANREAPDQIKKFATPMNAWGVGLSAPELFTLDYFRLFSSHWGIRYSLSPPIPFRIALRQEVQAKQVDGRLQVGTPAGTSYLNALYGPHTSIDALYFPVATSSFYFSGGLGYRRISVTGKLSSPIYVCFIEASEVCDESTKFGEAGANLKVNTEYQATSIMWRLGAGWFFPLSRNQYLHINVFGLTKALRTYRHASADAFLDGNINVGSDSSKAQASADEIIGNKSQQIESRTVDRTSVIENMAIPTVGVGTGFSF